MARYNIFLYIDYECQKFNIIPQRLEFNLFFVGLRVKFMSICIIHLINKLFLSKFVKHNFDPNWPTW